MDFIPKIFSAVFISASSLVLVACAGYEVTLNERVVYDPFPGEPSDDLLEDANLQGCLNQLLDENQSSIESITLIACPDSGISSLAGIEALSNLEQLELSNNAISDLSPLSNLKKLRVLSLRNNQVRDIRALNNLPILRFVSLIGNNNIPCRQLDTLQEKAGSGLSRPQSCRN